MWVVRIGVRIGDRQAGHKADLHNREAHNASGLVEELGIS